MKASELRIGNLVLDIYSCQAVKISTIYDDLLCFDLGDETNEADFTEIQPIILTEEIIVNSGGKIREKNSMYRRYEFGDHLSIKYSGGLFFVVINSIIVKRIKYLHELQNIHFCITNRELIYKT